MTDREKAIVMAYTGYCMLTGDKLSVFYEYVESIMGRPVYTHEMGTKVVDDLITEKARPHFIALCADESSSEKPNKTGHWIDHQMDRWIYAKCSECETIHDTRTNYCPHCGAKM